jgi:hypothetical protein
MGTEYDKDQSERGSSRLSHSCNSKMTCLLSLRRNSTPELDSRHGQYWTTGQAVAHSRKWVVLQLGGST